MATRCAGFDEWVLPGLAAEPSDGLFGLLPAAEESPSVGVLLRLIKRLSVLGDGRTVATAQPLDSQVTEWVEKSRDGDGAAMELLIRRYQPRVAGFVFALVGDGQVVDDLCQTIFLKAISRLPHLRATAQFEAWLFRIARNSCLDHLRWRRLQSIFVPWRNEAEEFSSPAEHVNDPRIETFRRALMLLPRRQRELLALLQDVHLSYEELAVITNSSVSSVKTRLFRARQQMRLSMQDVRRAAEAP